ncbi:hypothetical protein QYM36_014944 [Artemia franciscana]|uniref:Protein farnesyltransferase subunit beta n=1 Tax=Artemia franciscana TaxID=6661 RepID=A0AA88KU53_ARTSF|nr:hypothetical protein QYM36_014944 [Artemia franciscana]KAK2707083.1 hypothetical protein QYM36_014944 [Artemia franciscana]
MMSVADLLQKRLKILTQSGELESATIEEQKNTEGAVRVIYQEQVENLRNSSQYPLLKRSKHNNYLLNGLHHLPGSFECLDASIPWLCYWILHSLELLEVDISVEDSIAVVRLLNSLQSSDGGFGGGHCQLPHLAATYAAVCALCIIGTEDAYSSINRRQLLCFLRKMHQPDGSFTLHEGGEVDIRGVYCALAVAKLTNLLTEDLALNTDLWIIRCQTYEGGFAGYPGLEAHGGYTFCGYAGLALLAKEYLCDADKVLRWIALKQMGLEGGFQGRTNKLVDSCYSFWVGGVFPLLHRRLLFSGSRNSLDVSHWLFDIEALQEYILLCCQKDNGGFIDKPSKSRDFYHTCYSLSGLSISQHVFGRETEPQVIGHYSNLVHPIHPLYNIGLRSATFAHHYFKCQEVPR